MTSTQPTSPPPAINDDNVNGTGAGFLQNPSLANQRARRVAFIFNFSIALAGT